MGNLMTYPLQPQTISYHRPRDYDAYGQRKDIPKEDNEIHLLHHAHCEEVFAHRRSFNTRRKYLTDISDEEYSKKYSHWTPEEIGDLKIQFEIFDLNRDGLIDFIEMNSVLDEFGEANTPDARWKCLNAMDLDHSGAIDFEEFLLVLIRLGRSANDAVGANILNIVSRGTHQVEKIRHMNVRKQIELGLF